jgi:hypothetical protein
LDIEGLAMQEATMKHILLGGGGGGILYWAYAVFRGGQPAAEVAVMPPEQWLWVSLVLVIVLGAGAAFLMVYFLAATNTKEFKKAVGFAVACGLCWEPVLAGVSDRLTGAYVDNEAARSVAEARGLTAASASAAADTAASLVRTSSAIRNPILKESVRSETSRLVQMIQDDPDPIAKTTALQAVGEAAAEAGQPEVFAQTIRSLEAIAASEPQLAPRAHEAIGAIDRRATSR